MSETGARASDDAVPDQPVDHQAPPEEEQPAAGEVPDDEAPDDEAPEDEGPQPSWWHRSHPTFAGLVGFFVGVAYVIVVPGVYAAVLGLVASDSTAQELFPLVLLALVVPLLMLVPRKTRRFAQFMFLGIISTIVVVAVTAAVVVAVLVRLDG